MESRNSSSDNEGEYNDRDFMDHFDLEADKNRIVEHSPKGRFIRFNEELGSGAYKTVYKGYDNETGCEIAWNVIKLPKLPPKERKRISDEIALLKKLKHPNIISFISAWINKQKEEIVFITEVVTGGSLKKYLKKIKSPRLKVIKSWCREILQGIEYLHELKPHPIIHRDIKCDNIFINSNKGEIRIGDLGLATLMSNAYAASVLGTPEFMAPEMYDEVYGPSVDIYSFGMCLLEMVTNQTPYRECMNPAQVYKKVINGVKPASLGLIANEEVKGFICECLLPRDERPSATNLLNNRFLQSADQEADNQPVALFETPLENIKEDEHSYTMKTEITMPQQFDEELGDENDDVEDEKETSPTNVETNAEISESINQREELKNTELQKRKSSDCVNHTEKKHELFIASAAAGKFKSFDQISTILNNQKTGEKEFVEDIKNDAVQEKAELSFQQKQTPLPSARKDQIKYSLQSKGIINGQLVILIKGDMQGHQFEHTAEIRRDKISYEKVISKLQKQLSFLPITNDADFRNQVKTLLESIDYLNISTFMNSGLPPLNSATSIQIKSPSNGNFEFHSNHEKSSNNIFQSQLFLAFYDNYMSHLMKDNLWNETEEAMALRQQGELLELQNRHLLQKRTLWDKKHNVLSNSTIAIQSQTIETEDAHHRMNQIYDSHFKHSEARIKELGQNNFFFSPLSSGPLSPTTSGDNLGSANISVEIMASLLKKLGNTVDDHNRSTSHHPDNFSENVQRSNLASPNNQDILSKAAIEKGGSVFKFPAQLSTGANSHVSHNPVPQKSTNELINKLSPKNHTVYSSVTSPKDVAPIIGSPKGYKIVSQDNKVTPMKSVSDKEELHQRRFENPFNNNNEQKEEEKTAKIHVSKTIDTIQAKKQQDLPNKELIAAEAVDAKKENRYGSLTINTDIANQGEKTQTPSKTQGPQSVKIRTEEAPKQEAVAIEVKVPQKTISDTHLDKQDDTMPAMKKTSSTPKPATTVPPCSNAQPKQSSFRDQASSQHVNNLTAHSSVTRNSPVNATRPEKRYFTQQIVNNGGSVAQAQALYSPQQSYSTPKASVGNCQKFCFTLGKGQNEVSGSCEAKNCLQKGQPTYDLLKKIKGYKMIHTIGKNVTEANCEDIRVLQSCLELLTGQEISSTGGQYTPSLESQVKGYQEKAGLAVDGIVTANLWEKMLSSLEKMEKKWMTKEYMKQKEIDDLTKDREDLKKKLKDKQNKEASESLTKIESKLVDLSSLM